MTKAKLKRVILFLAQHLNFKTLRSSTIAIVNSPLQLLNLKELVIQKKLKLDTIFIFPDASGNSRNLIRTLRYFFNKSENINYQLMKAKHIPSLSFHKLVLKSMALFHTPRIIIIGDMRQDRLSGYTLLRKKNTDVIYIDDGMDTILMTQNNIKSLFAMSSYLFTIFNVNVKNIFKNDLIHISKMISKDDQKYEEVVFIGSCITDTNLMPQEHYHTILKKVIMKYGGVSYYPHRREVKASLETIRKLGFNIVYSTLPFEINFLRKKSPPRVIYCLPSTVIGSLLKISSSDTKIKMVVPNQQHLLNNRIGDDFAVLKNYYSSESKIFPKKLEIIDSDSLL